jgi:hypothetical protein
MATINKRKITREEVAKHNTQRDAWVIIGGPKTGKLGFRRLHKHAPGRSLTQHDSSYAI